MFQKQVYKVNELANIFSNLFCHALNISHFNTMLAFCLILTHSLPT